MASSSSSSSFSRVWKHDVFLSFRGEDTRNNFTSHLYKQLIQQGIATFKDDRELPRGEPFPQQILLAIHHSRILLVVFSKNYADSQWCLDELSEIYKCWKAGTGQIVLPVFYGVDPSDVGAQTGDFGAAFDEAKLLINDADRVQQWRTAATEIADLSGWDSKNSRNEADFIEEIIAVIDEKLMRRSSRSIVKDFVGMESRLEEFLSCLKSDQLDTNKIVGIVGMGGMGKTTLARAVCEEIRAEFDAWCFLEDIRETSNPESLGLVKLQNKLLSATLMGHKIKVYDRQSGKHQIRERLGLKKVLVILDDVNHMEQMEFLIGKRGKSWFGPGSRIIITTRDESLLQQRGVDDIYRVEELNDADSLQLFQSEAIRNGSQKYKFSKLCDEVVQYAGGLPLALKVLGASLYGKSEEDWETMVGRLKKVPNEKILSKLQLSYDGLEKMQKEVFLDIACFFNGYKEDYVITVLKSYRTSPEIEITVLKDKSLVTVTEGVLKTHDLLQEMGRQIVHEESPLEPGQRSRIWLRSDFVDVMENDTGSEKMEGIVLKSGGASSKRKVSVGQVAPPLVLNESVDQEDENLSAEAFLKMKRLRLLILQYLHFSEDIAYLPNNLSYLNWYGFPFKYFAPEFQPRKLVELHLQHSCIEYLWTNIKPVKSLKIMNLSHSKNLTKTPDFKQVPNLENLNLEGCVKLLDLHESIGALERLVSLNLKDCKKLSSLPASLCNLTSLKTLDLSGCFGLAKFLGTLGFLNCLEKLDVAGIGIMQLLLTRTRGFLQFFRSTPNPLALKTLAELNLSNMGLTAIPTDWSGFPSLEILILSGNDFLNIPSTISQLSRLTYFEASECKRLRALPDLSPRIENLNVEGCVSLKSLPDLFPLEKLKEVVFKNCSSLQSVPPLPSSVQYLGMENCTSLQTVPVLSDEFRLCSKRSQFKIFLSNCSALNDIQDKEEDKVEEKLDMIPTWLERYMSFVALIRRGMKIYNSCKYWNQCRTFCWQEFSDESDPAQKHPDVFTYFPGSAIPKWFTHQKMDEQDMRIELSPNEYLGNIAGFAFCAVVERRPDPKAKWLLTVSGKTGELQTWSFAFPTPSQTTLRFNHLCMFFIMNDRLDFPTEENRPTQLLLHIPGNEIRNCGIRIVLDQDLDKMKTDIESLPPPYCSKIPCRGKSQVYPTKESRPTQLFLRIAGSRIRNIRIRIVLNHDLKTMKPKVEYLPPPYRGESQDEIYEI